MLSKNSEERYISPPESWVKKAGRDGGKYFCPECGRWIDSYWLRMS